jgi:hypothetical protein
VSPSQGQAPRRPECTPSCPHRRPSVAAKRAKFHGFSRSFCATTSSQRTVRCTTLVTTHTWYHSTWVGASDGWERNRSSCIASFLAPFFALDERQMNGFSLSFLSLQDYHRILRAGRLHRTSLVNSKAAIMTRSFRLDRSFVLNTNRRWHEARVITIISCM